MNRILAPIAFGVLTALAAPAALAQSAGTWTLGVGAHNVDPKSDNGKLVNKSLPTKVGSSLRPTLTAEQLAQVQEVIHPVVRTHPENGRKALFVSEGFTTRIVGLPDDESRDVLQQLYALSVLEANIYRHQWQPHDMVFWDNRSLIHLAAGCPAHLRRKLFRTTIQGDAPF